MESREEGGGEGWQGGGVWWYEELAWADGRVEDGKEGGEG